MFSDNHTLRNVLLQHGLHVDQNNPKKTYTVLQGGKSALIQSLFGLQSIIVVITVIFAASFLTNAPTADVAVCTGYGARHEVI